MQNPLKSWIFWTGISGEIALALIGFTFMGFSEPFSLVPLIFLCSAVLWGASWTIAWLLHYS